MFALPTVFTSNLLPHLVVRAQLSRPDGEIVWKQREWVSLWGTDAPGHSLEEYLENPELIREAIDFAAKVVIDALVQDLRDD